MKRTLAALIALSLLFMICAPSLAASALEGEWKSTQDDWANISIVIGEGNSFTIYDEFMSIKYNYMLMGNRIYLSANGNAMDTLEYELEGDQLTLTFSGERVKFYRVGGDAIGGLAYDAADSVGDVVNVDRQDVVGSAGFEIVPIDVVLVLDTSGSMASTNMRDGKSILDYAKESAAFFVETLTSLNPESRIAIVEYDNYVRTVIGLTRATDKETLLRSIRGLYANGGTNIGGGFSQAQAILDRDARDDCRRVVLMLTDGISNDGPDPIVVGKNLSQQASVFNIGLIGALSASEINETRRVLNEGYETQYFEVDFESIDDISVVLAETFITIATASSADIDSTFYKLFASEALDVRIKRADGQYLSSYPDDRSDSCQFGIINYIGINSNDKLIILCDGDYTIELYGAQNETCSYRLEKFDGAARVVERVANQITQAYSGFLKQIDIRGGNTRQRDLSFNPLDPYVFDSFIGRLTLGLHSPARGYAMTATTLRLNAFDTAAIMGEVPVNTRVQVLWREGDWFFVRMNLKDEECRGYINKNAIEFAGHVHEAFKLDGSYKTAYTTPMYTLPDDFSAIVGYAQSASKLTLIHVERDIMDVEWAYVQNAENIRGYVQASSLTNWQSIAPLLYRMRYKDIVDIPLNRMSIACGDYYTLALKDNGSALATGRNNSKQLNVSKWSDLVAVEVGAQHSLGLLSNGKVVAVGTNKNGQCNVSKWTNIIAIAAGDKHTVGLKDDGTLVAIGSKEKGQINIQEWKNIAAITCGFEHTVGIHANGRVYAVGNNEYGQLNVSEWKDIIAVAAGGFFTIGLREDGTVVGVGANDYHQLEVGAWRDIVAISAGDFYCLGLKDDGTVVAVGRNDYGQCNVARWSGVAQIAAGYRHAVALKYDGTLLSTGDNSYGQINVGGWMNIAMQD